MVALLQDAVLRERPRPHAPSPATTTTTTSSSDALPVRVRRNYNDVILEDGDADGRLKTAAPAEATCPGTWLNLTDGTTTWVHCATRGHPARVFRFRSARNALRLAVRMGAAAVSLRLDYDASAVRSVVQGCAFGWVAVGQFCVTAVEDFRLNWADAETECRRRGGHLASIPDQEAQRAIDDLLINRYSPRPHPTPRGLLHDS